MDIIFITDLRADAIIGIYDWERKKKQTVSVDIEMSTDITRAAATDQIESWLKHWQKNWQKLSEQNLAYSGCD